MASAERRRIGAGLRPADEENGKGATADPALASTRVEFLSAKPKEPFLLVASFLNPHANAAGYRRLQQFRQSECLGPDTVRIVGGWNLEGRGTIPTHTIYRRVQTVDRQIGLVLARCANRAWRRTHA